MNWCGAGIVAQFTRIWEGDLSLGAEHSRWCKTHRTDDTKRPAMVDRGPFGGRQSVTPESCAYADAYPRKRSDVAGGTDMRTRHGGNIVQRRGVCLRSQDFAGTAQETQHSHRGSYNRPMNERGRRRHWKWLLAIPLLLLVNPGVYARSTPELFGFPFFYWYQFAVVIATALLTGAVYWLTGNPRDE
jgi:uncharacterized protein DUF3311